MTPESQVIAIAEACGWSNLQDSDYKPFGKAQLVGKHPGGSAQNLLRVPDYLNDLNAMHEAIMSLTLEDQCNMLEILRKDVLKFTAPTITATADQHAEAFLKTLNLWK